MQIAVGNKIRYDDLKAYWLQYNVDMGYQVKVLQNQNGIKTKAKYHSICYTAPIKGWAKSTETCWAHIQ
jgi:hypothetical protein